MKIEIHNSCTDFNTYRAARVKSLFNAESGANFDLVADLPIDDNDWRIGLVVGPSVNPPRLFRPELIQLSDGKLDTLREVESEFAKTLRFYSVND